MTPALSEDASYQSSSIEISFRFAASTTESLNASIAVQVELVGPSLPTLLVFSRRSRAAEQTFAFLDQRELQRSVHPILSLDTISCSFLLHSRKLQIEATSKKMTIRHNASSLRELDDK